MNPREAIDLLDRLADYNQDVGIDPHLLVHELIADLWDRLPEGYLAASTVDRLNRTLP